ncbi:MAG: hypothetical protein AAGK97_09605 [Bacteroidota bacterium]
MQLKDKIPIEKYSFQIFTKKQTAGRVPAIRQSWGYYMISCGGVMQDE